MHADAQGYTVICDTSHIKAAFWAGRGASVGLR